MLGGFIWVIGDLFQQYAAKYVGISRGIPLSNSNQLWGLLWGILVFGELHGRGSSIYLEVIGGSLLLLFRVAPLPFFFPPRPGQTLSQRRSHPPTPPPHIHPHFSQA